MYSISPKYEFAIIDVFVQAFLKLCCMLGLLNALAHGFLSPPPIYTPTQSQQSHRRVLPFAIKPHRRIYIVFGTEQLLFLFFFLVASTLVYFFVFKMVLV